MHVVVLSVLVALVVCVLMLGAFGLFTRTRLAHRIEERDADRLLTR